MGLFDKKQTFGLHVLTSEFGKSAKQIVDIRTRQGYEIYRVSDYEISARFRYAFMSYILVINRINIYLDISYACIVLLPDSIGSDKFLSNIDKYTNKKKYLFTKSSLFTGDIIYDGYELPNGDILRKWTSSVGTSDCQTEIFPPSRAILQ